MSHQLLHLLLGHLGKIGTGAIAEYFGFGREGVRMREGVHTHASCCHPLAEDDRSTEGWRAGGGPALAARRRR